MRRTYAQRVDSLRPVVLIVVIRDHDLWRAGERRCGRRSRAAVVRDGSNAREQCVHVDLADREAVSFVLNK
jgi:hypothetical protein